VGLHRAIRWRWLTLGAVCLVGGAPPSASAITLGQADDAGGSSCVPGYDWVQRAVAAGDPYTVPSTGGVTSWRVTSWTTSGGPVQRQLTLKFFRPVDVQPDFYRAVAHDGPRAISVGGTTGNLFSVSLLVKAGDVLGFQTGPPSGSECAISTSNVGDTYGALLGDLQDGQANGPFGETSGYRLNIRATLIPDNGFSLSGIARNKRRGTATLAFDLPNPGQLTGSGKGAKVRVASVPSAGTITIPNASASQLLVKAKGKKKRKLNETGKVKLSIAVTYTPTGGDPRTQSLKVKLKKKI